MITTNTVFILGAGASVPFGFPTGNGLKNEICCKTLTHELSTNVLHSLGFDREIVDEFRAALSRSGRPSVDAFLEYREEFVDVGKAAIACALLPRENTDKLFEGWMQKREKPDDNTGNWYEHFFGVLSDGVPFNNFDKNMLGIITFNYDRSLGHYLFTALKNSYNKTDRECGQKLNAIPIIHVYGKLGHLEWQPPHHNPVAYNASLTTEIVRQASRNIKIVHETTNVEEDREFAEARRLLESAHRIYFLGFGFHPTNLKRLRMRESVKITNIRGTSLGLSLERTRIAENLGSQYLAAIYDGLVPKTVYDFLYNHVVL